MKKKIDLNEDIKREPILEEIGEEDKFHEEFKEYNSESPSNEEMIDMEKEHKKDCERHKNFMEELNGIKDIILLQTKSSVKKEFIVQTPKVGEHLLISSEQQPVGVLHKEIPVPQIIREENKITPKIIREETPKQKKWKLKIIIGLVLDFICSLGIFISLVFGAKYTGILSFILSFFVFMFFAVIYSVLIYFLVRERKEKFKLDEDICPHCKSKLIKGKVQQNEEKISQLISCSNQFCTFKKENIFNI